MDPLDKAFTVWLSPANGTTRPKPIHRRLDLIFAPRKYYACAVLGWSGSTSTSSLAFLIHASANLHGRGLRTLPLQLSRGICDCMQRRIKGECLLRDLPWGHIADARQVLQSQIRFWRLVQAVELRGDHSRH